MIDAAGKKMAAPLPGSYYERSWAMIANLMLYGAMVTCFRPFTYTSTKERSIPIVDVPAAPMPFWVKMQMDILVDQELNDSELQLDTTN